ncbi:hypothetical protein pb186bvf_013792 [Paramecium bursaria]
MRKPLTKLQFEYYIFDQYDANNKKNSYQVFHFKFILKLQNMLEGTYPHLRKFELIAQFFTQLKDITNLQEKKPRSVIKDIRPSDVILMEQNKKTIDQLVQDNNILHGGIQDCLLQKKMIQAILNSRSNNCSVNLLIVRLIQAKIQITLYQKDWDDQSKLLQELEVENQYLRKLLSLQFSDEQIKAIEQQQLNEELIFYDNFCISRKELDLKILEFDKTLGQRKQAYEQKYMNQIQYMSKNSAVYQEFEDNEKEEREMAMKKQKSVSQEEKHRILEELLKPIGGTKVDSSQFAQTSAEAKQKQMEILNQTPQKKEVKQKLAIEIDVSNKDSIEDQKIITLDEYEEDIKEPQKKSSQKENYQVQNKSNNQNSVMMKKKNMELNYSNNKNQHFMTKIIMMMTMMKISIKLLWTNRSNQSFQKHKKIRNYNIKFDFFFFFSTDLLVRSFLRVYSSVTISSIRTSSIF